MDQTRLVLAARNGDSAALRQFVDQCYPAVWRYCAGRLGSAAADDMAQSTFEHALRALPRYRAESTPLTWLLTIARNVCVDHTREHARRERRADALAAPAPDRETVVAEPAERLSMQDLIRRLDVDRREAFLLTQYIGLSYTETAQICNCPVGTIRSRVARARVELIEQINQSAPEDTAGSGETEPA